jgi:membrane-associated phospholipid phosphatase
VSTIAYQHGWQSYPYVAGAGVLLAGTTGYLRLGADKHWLTDVLAGGLFGAAVGVFVPMLELGQRRDGSRLATTVMPLGIAGTF